MEKTYLKNVRNVNTGVDPSRIQQDQPPYFVNWQEDDGNHYEFFAIVSAREGFKNKLIQYEIEDEYKRMNRVMAEVMPFTEGKKWQALSQYGYILEDQFDTKEKAEKYLIEYYSKRMYLIRQ